MWEGDDSIIGPVVVKNVLMTFSEDSKGEGKNTDGKGRQGTP